jgi:hypothetical protein
MSFFWGINRRHGIVLAMRIILLGRADRWLVIQLFSYFVWYNLHVALLLLLFNFPSFSCCISLCSNKNDYVIIDSCVLFLHYCIFKLQLVKFINTFHILCDTTYMLHFCCYYYRCCVPIFLVCAQRFCSYVGCFYA